MKTNKYLYTILASIGLISCNTEAPFQTGTQEGEGQVSTASISLQLDLDETIKVRSNDDNEELLKDFRVYFMNSSGQAVKQFKYSEMPEVVTLNAGNYSIQAVYGEDSHAAWNNPYFTGASKEFTVKPNQITMDLDPVVCSLQNVMVSVIFDNELLEHMSGAPQVEVYVNKEASLIFKKEHSDNKTPGYFKHSDVNTLTAEFKGVVDGVEIRETKTLKNVEKGKHYRLTFYRHVYTGDESGEIDGDIMVDAKVTVNDLSADIIPEEESILTDVTWPDQEDNKGDNENPGEENPGDNPDDPKSDGPVIELDKASTVEFGKINNVTEDDVVIMNITSASGITKFRVDIESETLSLTDVGATSNTIDLVEPGDMLETWRALDLLGEDETTLKGKKEVTFDITKFMAMLVVVKGEHHFILTVADNDGEKTVTLILNVP